MSKKIKMMLILITIVIASVAVVVLITTEKRSKESIQIGDSEYEEEGVLIYEGKEYKYNSALRTILFMGIDKQGEMAEKSVGNGGQSDSLILVILDSEKKTYHLLTISRDTMIEIQTYDINGNKLGLEYAQIALQYAYGDGEKRSCRLTKEVVSNLLYEIPVHSYAAITIEGFSVLTDQLGGVEITIPEDYTELDPEFEQGKTIVMDGKTAERYVRMRDKTMVGSNSERMKRQEQFLAAMVQKFQKILQENPDFFAELSSVMESYMQTDLTVTEVKKLASFEQVGDILSVPGEVKRDNQYDEFLVDNEKLKELVLNIFYKPKE